VSFSGYRGHDALCLPQLCGLEKVELFSVNVGFMPAHETIGLGDSRVLCAPRPRVGDPDF